MHHDLDPHDAERPLRLGCACGAHASPQAHGVAFAHLAPAAAALSAAPDGSVATPATAIRSLLPVAPLQSTAQEHAPPEKMDPKIGFIAISCARPLILADPLGFYPQQGLNTTPCATTWSTSWSAARRRWRTTGRRPSRPRCDRASTPCLRPRRGATPPDALSSSCMPLQRVV